MLSEIEALKHDLERSMNRNTELLTENEHLRKSMLEAYGLMAEGEIFEATAILKMLGQGEDATKP